MNEKVESRTAMEVIAEEKDYELKNLDFLIKGINRIEESLCKKIDSIHIQYDEYGFARVRHLTFKD